MTDPQSWKAYWRELEQSPSARESAKRRVGTPLEQWEWPPHTVSTAEATPQPVEAPPIASIDEVAREWAAAIAAGDEYAMKALSQNYSRVIEVIDDAIGSGRLSEHEARRLIALRQQVEAALLEVIGDNERIIQAAVSDAFLMGINAAHDMEVFQTMGTRSTWARYETIPQFAREALDQFTAQAFSRRSPLGRLLREMSSVTDAGRAYVEAISDGIAMGKNPREVARDITRRLAGESAARALTVARTEMLRSYRGAFIETLRSNADVVEGWQWRSALDRRSCPACWALHGSVHGLDEDMEAHPNCRCVMIPLTRTLRDLGIQRDLEETRYVLPESGEDVLRRAPRSVQEDVLGDPRLVEAFRDGRLSLKDFLSYRPGSGGWPGFWTQAPRAPLLQRVR